MPETAPAPKKRRKVPNVDALRRRDEARRADETLRALKADFEARQAARRAAA